MDIPPHRKNTLLILIEFVKTGNDWDEKPTSVDGVSFVKLPQNNTRTILQIKIKKNDKAKGLFLSDQKKFQAFRGVINRDDLESLLKEMKNDQDIFNSIQTLEPWKTIETGVKDIFYTKIPPTIPALLLLPTLEKGESNMRRKGIYIRNFDDLSTYRELYNNPSLDNAFGILDEINTEWRYKINIAKEKGKSEFFKQNWFDHNKE